MDLTEDDIKNMSPEELKELQKKNCIFCHIIDKKVQSKVVYEDDKCLAILDINPANPGHILLLPKEHYMIMPQIPDEEASYFFKIAKALSHVTLRALKTSGTNIFVANGMVAGQKSPHFMIHIIPRKENDKMEIFKLERKEATEQALETIRKKLANSLDVEHELEREIVETKEKENFSESQKSEISEKQPVKVEKSGGTDLDKVSEVLLGK